MPAAPSIWAFLNSGYTYFGGWCRPQLAGNLYHWQMLFNVDKCKVMHFGHNNLNMDYTLDGKVLDVIREEKDLGVLFYRMI